MAIVTWADPSIAIPLAGSEHDETEATTPIAAPIATETVVVSRTAWRLDETEIRLPVDIAAGEYRVVANDGTSRTLRLHDCDLAERGIPTVVPARPLYLATHGDQRWYFVRVDRSPVDVVVADQGESQQRPLLVDLADEEPAIEVAAASETMAIDSLRQAFVRFFDAERPAFAILRWDAWRQRLALRGRATFDGILGWSESLREAARLSAGPAPERQ